MKYLPLNDPFAELVRETTGAVGTQPVEFNTEEAVDKIIFIGGPMDGLKSVIPEWMAKVNREVTLINASTKSVVIYSNCYSFRGIRYYVVNSLLGD